MTEPTLEEIAAYREARRVAFVNLAREMAGERWQLPLAEPLGVSQGLLSHITTGRRPVTDELFQKLVDHSNDVAIQLAKRGAAIVYQAAQIRKVHLKTQVSDAAIVEQELEPDDDPVPTITP